MSARERPAADESREHQREEELLSMTLAEISSPEDRQEDFEGYQQTICGETSEYEAEKPYVRQDGQVVWVSVNTMIVRDESGHPLRTVAVIQDITSRVRVVEGLRFPAEAGEVLSSSLDYQES